MKGFSGRYLPSGGRGRRFESSHPDHLFVDFPQRLSNSLRLMLCTVSDWAKIRHMAASEREEIITTLKFGDVVFQLPTVSIS